MEGKELGQQTEQNEQRGIEVDKENTFIIFDVIKYTVLTGYTSRADIQHLSI